MLGQMDIERLLPFRARGLSDLEKRVGDMVALIDGKLKNGKRIRILETGFGFGTALMELRKKYGPGIELHGINRTQSHGDWDTMKTVAVRRGIFLEEEITEVVPPTLVFHDVNGGLPYPDNYFDIVYSQASFMFYAEKSRFLEEVNRVLGEDGVARIDLYINRPGIPSEYAVAFEIWQGEAQIPFWEYVKQFGSFYERAAKRRSYLEMFKTPVLDLGLELVYAIDLNYICKTWHGSKSVYRVKD
ncbi:methyltransferase domain-containing protein [Marilutibacter chinensis]|uniref:Methyltransferase domain-containing protein n=1 Tax=Marilutibacter chinensis TaxID=2912247 RepID=A0ABS9HY36_9GAMM|nr:methyltransferase domain-containing protein [Lysobacter chinensis]MCF7223784.1 methyltransferase domain-containing protein [Lysobacter chinensis]